MKLKYLKVYKAPGYPVDPSKQLVRIKDFWINSLAPQNPIKLISTSEIQYNLLTNYLNQRIN
jgi:hypothetical protein